MRLTHIFQKVMNFFFGGAAVRGVDAPVFETGFANIRARQMDDIQLERFTGKSKTFKMNQRKERAASAKRKARKRGQVK